MQVTYSCLSSHLFQVYWTPGSTGGSYKFHPSVRQSVFNTLYVGLAHFSDFWHEIRVKRLWKLTGPFFEKNTCFAQNGVNEAFLVPKSTLLNVSRNLLIRFFWNFICSLDFSETLHDKKEIKIGQKWQFWIFKEDSYYAQNQRFSSFTGPKSTPLNFSLIWLIRFFSKF